MKCCALGVISRSIQSKKNSICLCNQIPLLSFLDTSNIKSKDASSSFQNTYKLRHVQCKKHSGRKNMIFRISAFQKETHREWLLDKASWLPWIHKKLSEQ